MKAKFKLTPNECRIIGCLIEKEITTPEQYPLSINGLMNACNQKSNRDPVMELDEGTVQKTVDQLIKKYRVSKAVEFHNRVPKYKHQFCNTEFGDLKLNDQELGIICVLLLRGPQTPGELRSRTNRLCDFNDVHETESTISTLLSREDGPFVVKLPREPGKRESRYQHLFSEDTHLDINTAAQNDSPNRSSVPDSDRLRLLENQIQELQSEVECLRKLIENIQA